MTPKASVPHPVWVQQALKQTWSVEEGFQAAWTLAARVVLSLEAADEVPALVTAFRPSAQPFP